MVSITTKELRSTRTGGFIVLNSLDAELFMVQYPEWYDIGMLIAEYGQSGSTENLHRAMSSWHPRFYFTGADIESALDILYSVETIH